MSNATLAGPDEQCEPGDRCISSAESRQSEEWANCLTHGAGLCLSILAGLYLLRAAAQLGDIRFLLGCGIFSGTMVAVYAASTLSHAFHQPKLRQVFRAIDQGVIYLFIAGSYTPLSLIYLQGFWWNALLGLMWAIAIFGFVSKVGCAYRVNCISTRLYVLQGWLPAIAAWPIAQLVPADVLHWMVAGGLCYTAGVAVLLLDERVRYFHSLWHLLVIAGTACHYMAVLRTTIPSL